MEKDIERKERYEIVFLNGLDKLCSIQDTEAEIPTFYNDLGYINHIKPVCDLLNDKEAQIRELKKENERLKEKEEYCDNICKSFGDYYGMNIENAEWFGFNGDVE